MSGVERSLVKAEIAITIASIAIVILWVIHPEKPYEPILAALGVVLGLFEIYRRRHRADELTSDAATARRYLDQPHQVHFINGLPALKEAAKESSRVLWDSGITANMRQGSYDYIDFLQDTWVRLAEFFPPRHFEGKLAREYISDYTTRRFSYHRAILEPDGPGTGGTIVGVMAGGGVMADLEQMIEDTVLTLSGQSDAIDFPNWKKKWSGKA